MKQAFAMLYSGLIKSDKIRSVIDNSDYWIDCNIYLLDILKVHKNI